ncbi:hypothetical protein ABIE21_000823 [Conyzicola nivalis]|uniref:DUF5648 domain-containing protein n=1 Tax=Conyzicola nivalis TaxID=1477021 RepID=A0ABV2QJU8_9MICO
MRSIRPVSLVVGASLALFLGVPTIAATEPASAVPNAAVGDAISLDDASLVDEPQVQLSGEVLVIVSEPPLDADPAESHHDLTSYLVVTDEGVSVPIAGAVPQGVASGDEFSGTVAVPQAVIDELPTASASAVESSTDARPLDEDSLAAADVLDAAVAHAVALPVAEASVAAGPLAAAGIAKAHEVKIVMITPVGAAASGMTDAAVRDVVAKSTVFWSTASRGLVPSFTTDPAIPRFASATACNNSPMARWNEAAGLLGYPSADAYLNAAPAGVEWHLMVVLPASCLTASGPGVASVGSGLHSGGVLQVVIDAGVDRQVITHELGHNLSLGHSNLDHCAADAATAGCIEYGYEDRYDVMGVSIGGMDAKPTALNARHQVALGFQTVSAGNRYDLTAGSAVNTTVTIGRIDGGAAPTILEVVDPQSSVTYYVEYRAGEAGAYYSAGRNVGIDTGRAVNLRPGVRLVRANGSGGSSVITQADATLGVGYARPYAAAGQSIQSPTGAVRVTVNSASESAGASVTVSFAPPTSQSVFRFWSPTMQSHFYTSSVSERDGIIARYPTEIWTYEGPRFEAFTTPVEGTVPLHRFWSERLGGHFYTANDGEKQSVIDGYDDDVWAYEGTAFYVYPNSYTATPTLSVARFWSPQNQHHFYTASAEEAQLVRDNYPANIWTYEMENFRVPVG